MGKIEDVFAENLRESLIEADMSARALAKKVAEIESVTVGKQIVPPTSLMTKYMQAEVYPRPERVRSIAQALGKDELELIAPKGSYSNQCHTTQRYSSKQRTKSTENSANEFPVAQTGNSVDKAIRQYIMRVVNTATRFQLNTLKSVCKLMEKQQN